MLDPWIIEEIRRREEERAKEERSHLELPLDSPRYEETSKPEEREERGVVVIDL